MIQIIPVIRRTSKKICACAKGRKSWIRGKMIAEPIEMIYAMINDTERPKR